MRRLLESLLIALIAVAAFTNPADAARRNYRANKAARSAALRAPQTAQKPSVAPLIASALAQEVAGNNDGRAEYLRQALEKNPLDPAGHWHSGRVYVDGQWLSIDDAFLHNASDHRYAEYRNRRLSTNETVEAQTTLALWCRTNGFQEECSAHLFFAIKNNSGWVNRWTQQYLDRLNRAQQESRRLNELVIRGRSLQRWTPQVESLINGLNSSDEAKYAKALAELVKIRDFEATPAIHESLSVRSERTALAAVAWAGSIQQQSTTEFLADVSVESMWQSVRNAAAAELQQRSIHDWAPILLAKLRWPTFVHVYVHHLPGKNAVNVIRYEQGLQEGKIRLPRRPDMHPETLVQRVKQSNVSKSEANVRIAEVLMQATDAKEFDDPHSIDSPERWWKWWSEYTDAYFAPAIDSSYRSPIITSCFVAGTPVWTATGPMSIEKVQMGDTVLSQNTDTGELKFKAVLATTVRPATNLLTVRTGDYSITATRGHPFWVTGKGWRMTKELSVGDRLHTPTGSVAITGIEEAKIEPTYNLVVGDFNSYFVGENRLLVHDNTLRQPTEAVLPGLFTN